MNISRVRKLNNNLYAGGDILCSLGRDIRAQDNDALIYASQLAHKNNVNLIVTINIWPLFLGATSRYYDFFFEGLVETEQKLRSLNIPLVLLFGKEDETLHTFISKNAIGMLITDFLPLHFSKIWKKKLLNNITIPFHEVDAHNLIPVWITSSKREFSARTIRPKIYTLFPQFLEEYDEIIPFANTSFLQKFPTLCYEKIRNFLQEKRIATSIFKGGEEQAKKELEKFLLHKLTAYNHLRNNYTTLGQSDLSPFITKGMLSKRRIILDILQKEGGNSLKLLKKNTNGSNEEESGISAFLEEIVVRSELAENFVYYTDEYTKIAGAPEWAKEVLEKTKNDKREYVYTLEQFESASTHDALWNAAQNQMLQTGKMHGYLRMYWAKKILEWTKSVDDALQIAIYLNDTYELDGMDPNGYAGIMWSIAGLHDRPWFKRPIFGTIRYMAISGVEKRGDINSYIQTWNVKK